MPYILVEDFRGGLDKRRPAIAAVPGTLQKAVNVHVSRGGDLEKRKAFVSHATIPAGTFGFASAAGNLYVFGSGTDPGVPAGITYQRLQHPDGFAMSAIRSWSVYSGKLYVLAEYSNGDVLHFYDGAIVSDWIDGVVRASFTNNDGTAAHLSDLINAADTEHDIGVSSTSSGSVITVTADENVSFDITALAENVAGGTDDQTLTVAQTQTARADLDEELASCSFQVINGTEATDCKIKDITVNGVSIISTTDIPWTGTNEYTAQLIVDAINGYTSSPNYTAEAEGNTVVILAAEGTGNSPNGFALEVETGEEFIISIGSFTVTGGTSNPGTNRVTNVTVDGASILSSSVDWATSNSATAEAIASKIRTTSATYTAYADGPTVHVSRLTSTAGLPNSLELKVFTGGDFAVGGSTDDYITQLNTTLTDMSGGVDFVAGQPQVSTLTVGGTFEVGDRFSTVINDVNIGGTAVGGEKATAVITHKQKVYVVFGPTLAFSGVGAPTEWGQNAIGAGQIDMSSQAAGSETLTALAVYQTELAVFARRAIQREFVDVDEDQNTHLQTINNFGTIAPGSVVSFGESDVFFLADNGVRSLRARDSSNTAAISDIGTPIDPVVILLINSLTQAQIAGAKGVIEPEDGRYLLSIDDNVYVFSFFPVSKISAWTEYDLDFSVDDWATADNRLYARSGDTIYIYGGADNATYDDCAVDVELPFMDGRKIAHFKNWNGYDAALEGTWSLYAAFDPNNPDNEVYLGTVFKHTFDVRRHGTQSRSTHVSLRARHEKAEAAKLINVAFSYEGSGTE